jgi:hypothetical protein
MTSKIKRVYFKIIIIALTYAILELICFIFINSGSIPAMKPTFRFTFKNPKYPLPIADIDSIWGAWHYKESFQYQRSCINFDYKINSYGARDKERLKVSENKDRVIVLGDSFFEGYGVTEENRLSNLLEKQTGKEFLNFSCAEFGTTQEYLVYKHLAAGFEHSTILIGFLPFNDFENDDLTYLSNQKRYRPYFVKTDSTYQLEYHNTDLQSSEFNKSHFQEVSNTAKGTVVRFLSSFTFWYNIIDYYKNRKQQNLFYSTSNNKTLSYYYDYKKEQIGRLEYTLKQLRLAAPNKRIVLCTIPIIPDIIRRNSDNEPPLPIQLKRICSDLNITYTDLLPYFKDKKNFRDYFFFCDWHWNNIANKYAAEILSSYFN